MILHYCKQAWLTFRQTPLVSVISLLGTALSIAMIMVVILLFQIKLIGYSPESERARMLYVYGTLARHLDDYGNNNGKMSAKVVKECYYSLKTPRAVTAFTSQIRPVSLPHKRLFEEYTVKYTDPGFWNVFDFTFVSGQPFTEADFRSELPVAVISAGLARTLFGREEAIGKTILIDYLEYRIAGVVKSVSQAAEDAFAEVWVPYTTNTSLMQSVCEGIAGPFSVVMLAPSTAAKADVCRELEEQMKRFNSGQKEYTVGILSGHPLDRLEIAIGNNGFFREVTLRDYLFDTGGLLLFLLLVPALNLVSVVHSAVQKRSGELGLRRAFGASEGRLISQVLSENMILTLIGSVVGLVLSVGLLYVCRHFLMNPEVELQPAMLFKPAFFLSALCFAVLLNFLSACIPAWKISKKQIVTALSEER